jgi:hypothetical protein
MAIMPYQSPGGAFADAMQDYQMRRLEIQHNQLVDELTVQEARRKNALADAELKKRNYEEGRQEAQNEISELPKGAIPSPDKLEKWGKYNVHPRMVDVPDPNAPKPPLPSSTLPGSTAAPNAGTMGPMSVPPPQKTIRAYAGSPTEQFAESLPGGTMKKALQVPGLPESVIRIAATEEDKKLAAQQRWDQLVFAEQGRMERAEMSSADRAASRESTAAWREAALELRRAAKDNNAVPTLSPEGKAMAAKLYAKTGQLPPMGMGAAGANVRTAIIDMAATYDPSTDTFTDKKTGIVIPGGPDLAANKAAFKANETALVQVTKTISAVESFSGAAKKNGEALKKILDKVPDLNATFLNKPARAAMTALGSTDQTAFNILMRSLNNEYARIVSQPNLSGQLTDTARKEMEAALRPDATVQQIKVALETLQLEAGNRYAGLKEQQDALNGAIKGGNPSGDDKKPADPMGIR